MNHLTAWVTRLESLVKRDQIELNWYPRNLSYYGHLVGGGQFEIGRGPFVECPQVRNAGYKSIRVLSHWLFRQLDCR